jgi:ABC-type antimicrobial peptide transport system permease subunit
LASFTAEQRTKEIGIRKVLGASISAITLSLCKNFAGLVLLACIFAWPAAYFISRDWLNDFAYRISLSPVLFFITGFLALLIALLTVGYQAIKAARANPVDSLLYE